MDEANEQDACGEQDRIDAARLRERIEAVVARAKPAPVERRRGERRGVQARHDRRVSRKGRRAGEPGPFQPVVAG